MMEAPKKKKRGAHEENGGALEERGAENTDPQDAEEKVQPEEEFQEFPDIKGGSEPAPNNPFTTNTKHEAPDEKVDEEELGGSLKEEILAHESSWRATFCPHCGTARANRCVETLAEIPYLTPGALTSAPGYCSQCRFPYALINSPGYVRNPSEGMAAP